MASFYFSCKKFPAVYDIMYSSSESPRERLINLRRFPTWYKEENITQNQNWWGNACSGEYVDDIIRDILLSVGLIIHDSS